MWLFLSNLWSLSRATTQRKRLPSVGLKVSSMLLRKVFVKQCGIKWQLLPISYYLLHQVKSMEVHPGHYSTCWLKLSYSSIWLSYKQRRVLMARHFTSPSFSGMSWIQARGIKLFSSGCLTSLIMVYFFPERLLWRLTDRHTAADSKAGDAETETRSWADVARFGYTMNWRRH